jgi:hypothetical protein
MGVSKALRRLLRIRDLEEEQYRLALETTLENLRNLESARDASSVRERQGRALVGASVSSGEVIDRHAGLVETDAGRRISSLLAPHIAATEFEVTGLRAGLLGKRVERRQAETLIEHTEIQQGIEDDRRGQRSLDDWFGARKHREKAE